MSSEYPTEYYVTETHHRTGGGSVSKLAAGPFDEPDQARSARDEMLNAEPGRNLKCVFYTYLDGGPRYG